MQTTRAPCGSLSTGAMLDGAAAVVWGSVCAELTLGGVLKFGSSWAIAGTIWSLRLRGKDKGIKCYLYFCRILQNDQNDTTLEA